MIKNVILHGDCLEKLRELDDNSIDAVVTDPPYGLSKEPNIVEVLTKWLAGEDYNHRGGGFMSKEWDAFVPGPSIWREVFRVLKPGGHVLCFAGTRTQDLMTISLRLAGFEIRDIIEWLYFSGFPKSMDVGKALDRRKGGGTLVDEVCAYLRQKRDEKGLKNQDIDRLLGLRTGDFHYFAKSHSNSMIPPLHQYKRLKEILELDDRYDELIEAAEREKIGEKTVNGEEGTAGGYKNGIASLRNSNITEKRIIDITAPATDLAKKWDGWGTALKPAHEPIILARKPIEKNVAYNVEKYGTGAININGCRIWDENKAGRFPANCITTERDAFFSKYFNITPPELSKKASKKDRNSDWRGEEISLPLREKVFGNDKGDGFGRGLSNSKHPTRNNHPTVKPTDLMAWLVRLITPPGGVVLDPFAGSGSTLVAAKREGFNYIGIERESEYVEIARARVGEEIEKEDE
jgi:DNA modification methylase